MSYYKNTKDIEIQEMMKFMIKNGLQVFNYDFMLPFIRRKVPVYKDENCGLFYVLENGKKLYFARYFNSKKKVLWYYNSICAEQDIQSPHKYLDNSFFVEKGSVCVDLGVAEGNFALQVIDEVSEMYLFECEEAWIEALEQTFKAYKHKVHIIKKYVSDKNTEAEITLDTFFVAQDKKINFIKMDIEGAEPKAIEGAKNILMKNDDIKLAICTYHNQSDEQVIKEQLVQYGFKDIQVTDGYMVFIYDQNLQAPFLRRALIRATK